MQGCYILYHIVAYRSVSGLKNIFTPQFAMWYLLALYIWRTLLTDLIRIKFVLPISIALNLLVPFCTGIDNVCALQRTIGFMCFFMLGYNVSVRRWKIPNIKKWICAIALAAEAVVLIYMFYYQNYEYTNILYVFTYTRYATEFPNLFVCLAIYIISFIIAILNSILAVNLIDGNNGIVRKLVKNTLPIYFSHCITLIFTTMC